MSFRRTRRAAHAVLSTVTRFSLAIALAVLGLFTTSPAQPVAAAPTFANGAPIAIPVFGNATPYPSRIAVSGVTGVSPGSR